jgi:hemerythrin
MSIKWTSDLATGIAIIDKQHQELFVKVNNLIEAMSKGKGKDELGNTIKFLGDYVLFHFSAEERIMQDNKYPSLPEHKELHKLFVDDFLKMKKEFSSEGASSFLSIEIQSRIGDWLINHIGKVDKKFGEFLKDKNK